VRRHLEAEVDAVLGPDGLPTLEDLPKLVYTRRVIEESLRLRPPAWTTGRLALDTHVIEGEHTQSHRIPEGSLVLLSPWVTHHRADLWENPEGFDPDRWAAFQKPGDLHPFKFFPFGGGPRKCVGEQFAYLEATIVLAMIAQRVCLDLVPGHPIEPSPQITLGLKHGLRVRVRGRERDHAG
jgi:cytochrome P450